MGPEQKILYLLLDGHGWTYHPKPGISLHRPSSHVTPGEYEVTKETLEEPEKIAERVFAAFSSIRRDGQVIYREPSNLIAEGGRYFVDKVRSMLPDSDKPPVITGAFSGYDVDVGIPNALRYARNKKARVILNTGSPDINLIDLLRKMREDKILHLFNPGIAIAMRTTEIPGFFKDRLNQSVLTTPFSKGSVNLWVDHGIGGEPVTLEDMVEPTEWVRALGYDAAMNCTKNEAEYKRVHATPDFLKPHLTADGPRLTPRGRGVIVYRATIARVIDWKLGGLNGVKIVPITDGKDGEYEFYEPKLLVQKPEVLVHQSLSI